MFPYKSAYSARFSSDWMKPRIWCYSYYHNTHRTTVIRRGFSVSALIIMHSHDKREKMTIWWWWYACPFICYICATTPRILMNFVRDVDENTQLLFPHVPVKRLLAIYIKKTVRTGDFLTHSRNIFDTLSLVAAIVVGTTSPTPHAPTVRCAHIAESFW